MFSSTRDIQEEKLDASMHESYQLSALIPFHFLPLQIHKDCSLPPIKPGLGEAQDVNFSDCNVRIVIGSICDERM